jgi:hypothetical protein
MHKYAAATALALITMLTLTVSASLTPANAGGGFCGNYGIQGIYCHCASHCWSDAGHEVAVTAAGAPWRAFEKKKQACVAKCVNAAEAARH